MAVYRDEGIVLRSHKLGEADRIVTILTRQHGIVRAVAKGVRRTTSRFGARLEPFGHVDLQLYEGRNLDTVVQVVILRPYGADLATNYEQWTAASTMAETVTRVADDSGPQLFLLLMGGLRALIDTKRDAGLVVDAFLLRSLAVTGWSPSFADCAQCGEPGPHGSFHLAAGGASCPACRQPGSLRIRPTTVQLLGALLSGDWEHAETSNLATRKEARALITRFMQWHTEGNLRSLPLLERPAHA